MSRGRFSGVEGRDYDFATLAFQDYRVAQRVVGRELEAEFKDSRLKRIKVLELGCGTGVTSLRILKSDPRIGLLAVDSEKVMVKQAHEKTRGYSRVTFMINDALEACDIVSRYLCGDRRCDAVVSGFMIHNLERQYRTKLYNAIHDVLRSRGIFVEADKIAPDNQRQHEAALQWQLKQFDKYEGLGRPDVKEAWVKHYKRDNREDLILRESELVDGLKNAGFRDIKKLFRRHMEAVYIARKK